MQQFFLGCTGPHFGPTNTNHAKNYQKITFGALFRIPPQNALQCTTVQCNGLKCKRLNYSLQMGQIRPIMTQDDCVWQGMAYQAHCLFSAKINERHEEDFGYHFMCNFPVSQNQIRQ